MATADQHDEGDTTPGQREVHFRPGPRGMVCTHASELYALALICTLTLGLYYAFDIPAALPSHFLHLAGGHQVAAFEWLH
eukprot:3621508-Pleurochrysis_carterae.AAC.4